MLDLALRVSIAGSFVPHGHCYLWYPPLVWLHLLSDAAIALSYYSIPLTLLYFVRRRTDLPYGWIFLLFAAFIISCGTTHLMEIWTLWHPDYWVSGGIKALTALVSAITAIALVRLIPQALTLPSPAQLEATNRKLQREIGERQRVETELRQSEARYRAIVEDQTEAIARFSGDGTIAFVNHAYCRYFNVSRHSVLGRHYQPRIYAEDRDRVEAAVAELCPENPVRTVEHRVQLDNGVRWMQWINRMVFDGEGNFLEYQSVGRDITEQKQAERAVQESEQLLRAIFDRSFQLVGVLQPDGTLLKVNRTALEFIGLVPEQVEGVRIWDLPETQLSAELRSQLEAAVGFAATGVLARRELDIAIPDRPPISLDLSVKPVFGDSGDVNLLIAEGRDVTERKQRQRIEASLRQKEVLLKEIHHRVKNNLQVICSLLNLQARSLKDDTAIAQFQESQNRVRSMALIHEKLYQSDSHAQFHFGDYIRDLAARLFRSYTVPSTDVAFETEIDENCLLEFDIAIPCGLIVNELISNALKYAFPEQSRGRIFVKAVLENENEQSPHASNPATNGDRSSPASGSTRYLTLSVCDDGVGMPDDLNWRSPKTLGLSLVVGLANQLRAELSVGNDGGTSVSLRLRSTSPDVPTPVAAASATSS